MRLLNDGRVYPRADKGLTPRYARRSRRSGQFLLVCAGLITSFMAHSRGGDRPDHVLAPPASAPDRWNRRPCDGRQQPGHNLNNTRPPPPSSAPFPPSCKTPPEPSAAPRTAPALSSPQTLGPQVVITLVSHLLPLMHFFHILQSFSYLASTHSRKDSLESICWHSISFTM